MKVVVQQSGVLCSVLFPVVVEDGRREGLLLPTPPLSVFKGHAAIVMHRLVEHENGQMY